MWRDVVQIVGAFSSATVGFMLSVLAHLLDVVLRYWINLQAAAPAPREQLKILRKDPPTKLPTILNDTTSALPSHLHVSFSPEQRRASTSPQRRARPPLLKSDSAPVPTRAVLGETPTEDKPTPTALPESDPVASDPISESVQNPVNSDIKLSRRSSKHHLRPCKAIRDKLHHSSSSGPSARAPAPRTQPYAAPYFFPSPDSPDAVDYAQRVMEERRLTSQHSTTFNIPSSNPVVDKPSPLSISPAPLDDSLQPPKSAGLVQDPGPVKRRPSWVLGRKPRPSSFHEGDFKLHRRKSSLLSQMEPLTAEEVNEPQPTARREPKRRSSLAFFHKKPRQST